MTTKMMELKQLIMNNINASVEDVIELADYLTLTHINFFTQKLDDYHYTFKTWEELVEWLEKVYFPDDDAVDNLSRYQICAFINGKKVAVCEYGEWELAESVKN